MITALIILVMIIDLKITKVQIDQTQLRVQIWDTSGDDKYLSITKGDPVICYLSILFHLQPGLSRGLFNTRGGLEPVSPFPGYYAQADGIIVCYRKVSLLTYLMMS